MIQVLLLILLIKYIRKYFLNNKERGIVPDINMTIVHKYNSNIDLYVLAYKRSAMAILVYLCGSGYITLPKIMILGIVRSNQKGLFYEPLFLSIPVI